MINLHGEIIPNSDLERLKTANPPTKVGDKAPSRLLGPDANARGVEGTKDQRLLFAQRRLGNWRSERKVDRLPTPHMQGELHRHDKVAERRRGDWQWTRADSNSPARNIRRPEPGLNRSHDTERLEPQHEFCRAIWKTLEIEIFVAER